MKLPREFFIPKGATKVADKASDAVAYVYTGRNGKPLAAVFFGKQAKPVAHYSFRSEAARAKYVAELFDNRRQAIARKAAAQAERKAWVSPFKVGDIFRTCWGYDQTNVEYFEIVELRGKHAILREIAQHRTETGFMSGKCAPKAGDYIGEPIRRLCQPGGFKISDCRWASAVKMTEIAGVKVADSAHWSSYA